ncbi:MAG TPA: kelch repeat-containing protein [Thermomicrobiales bacterium]|nr:kelch repeat-containing protein [Thermomicrobiales bacterium]
MRAHRLMLAPALLGLLLAAPPLAAPRVLAAASWMPAPAMSVARSWHTATLLRNGTVLVAGGLDATGGPTASVERYDPTTDTWAPAAPMTTPRAQHTATLLADGRVLVTGGRTDLAEAGSSVEVYDPAADAWTAVAPLGVGRVRHSATLLRDGRVLVAGGETSPGTAELFDPATGRWSPAGTLTTGRFSHTATLLPNGRVLVAGGMLPLGTAACPSSNKVPCPTAAAEVYDPATNAWAVVASSAAPHGFGHSATLLPDGTVLVVGGFTLAQFMAERYDPAANAWRRAGAPPPADFVRVEHTATLLADGRVLIAGGGQAPSTASTALYDPASNTWTPGPAMGIDRYRHTATRLLDGRVLVTGGGGIRVSSRATAEVYDPGVPAACFVQTDVCMQGRFLAYWRAHGGLATNGYPLSYEFGQQLEDGNTYTVQYFERVRMEDHPENPPPWDVELGQFGRRILQERTGHGTAPPAQPKDGFAYFQVTGHNVAQDFYAYWQANGGLAQFGYPVTEEYQERLEDGKTYTVQYFERARFERHPENQPPWDIELGQFGRQILAERGR